MVQISLGPLFLAGGGRVVVVVLIGRLLDGWLLVCTQISLGRLVNLVSVLKREKLPRAGILRSTARLIVKLDRQTWLIVINNLQRLSFVVQPTIALDEEVAMEG